MSVTSNSFIIGNTIYSNTVGIQGQSNNTFRNNLIYANALAGVALSFSSGGVFDGNTVYQLTGSALTLSQSVVNFTVKNNILAAANAVIESVTADSEVGYVADYNDRVNLGSASLLQWGSKVYTTRSDIFFDLGFEAHGQTSDPQFVNPAGPDGMLGFSATPIGTATIIDDGDANYSQTGSWTTVTTGGFQGDYRTVAENINDSNAVYTFSGLTPGAFYQLAGTWPAGGPGFSNTQFIVHTGNAADRAFNLSQVAASTGFSDAGAIWQIAGHFPG